MYVVKYCRTFIYCISVCPSVFYCHETNKRTYIIVIRDFHVSANDRCLRAETLSSWVVSSSVRVRDYHTNVIL